MRLFLYLLSVIYGLIITVKNFLFDHNILKSKTHNIPIICIGNLSMGGSGKTPHTKYIAKLLSKNYKVAILSRGYGRKSSGFKYVKSNSDPSIVGDEPLEIKTNNPNCIVAVNNNRNKAVEKIQIDHPEIDVILLDDGFQHRKIKAGLNIIVTPFLKPFFKNKLIPLGTLRESTKGSRRADIIIVSKIPSFNAHTKKKTIEDLSLKRHQQAYFSKIKYQKYKSLQDDTELNNLEEYNITLVTGIANPNPLIQHLKEKEIKFNLIRFVDHHNYTEKDIEKILLAHKKNKSLKKLILTTEKDAMKLKQFLTIFKQEKVYYSAIDITINNKEKFKTQLLNYVKKN